MADNATRDWRGRGALPRLMTRNGAGEEPRKARMKNNCAELYFKTCFVQILIKNNENNKIK